jgi:hypothetical protein
MPTNKKYHKSALYYPDDKDIYDFLQASNASARKLRAYLLKRGVYLAKDATTDMHCKYVSRLSLAWHDLVELVDLVDLAEKKEKNTFTDLKYKGDFSKITSAFEDVKANREDTKKEEYKITQENGNVVVEINYIEIDNEKTPMLQGRPSSLKIVIEPENGGIRATYNSNERASQIVREFAKSLEKINTDDNGESKSIETSQISLKSILNAELRVSFFTNLIRSIEGFDYISTMNVRVSRIPQQPKNPDDDDPPKLDPDQEQQIKNVIIQGINIQSTKQYKELIETGFFISNITWESVEKESKDRVSLSAGFKNPDEADGFEYKINYRYVLDKGLYGQKEKILPFKIPSYNKAIQQSSMDALGALLDTIRQNPTPPAPRDTKPDKEA